MAAFVAQLITSADDVPTWVMVAFGFAVIGGTLGCVALLIRKEWAINVFMMSLAGVLTQMTYIFFFSGAFEGQPPTTMAMPILIVVVAILLIPFSATSRKRGWLR